MVDPFGITSLGLRARSPAVAAFQSQNLEASRDFHRKITDEPHRTNTKKTYAKYVETGICHGSNGLIHSTVLLASLASLSNSPLGASLSPQAESLLSIIIVVVALVSTGFSLAFSNVVKKQEYKAFYEMEKRRESWETENFLEGEQKEMVELYQARGVPRADAEVIVRLLSKDKKIFVDVMMKEELELMPPDEVSSPLTHVAVTCLSFAACGLLPVLPQLARLFWHAGCANSMLASLFVSYVALFVAGSLKSLFTVTIWWKSGLQLTLNGVLGSLVALLATKLCCSVFL
eukprot:TRINITY_DN19624_c0_g1_i1.p1 TRINITY_DN19624_c0_g1~~TRINITY_DN19624_c0_g1_i1.p1  ORF type:complete len:303 (-),score=47.37 TRINITY_DN19624_c0_g1_i1:509-1375(-)